MRYRPRSQDECAPLVSNANRQSVSGAGPRVDTLHSPEIYFGRKPRRAKSSKLLPLPRKLIFLASAPAPPRETERSGGGRKSAKQRCDKRNRTSAKTLPDKSAIFNNAKRGGEKCRSTRRGKDCRGVACGEVARVSGNYSRRSVSFFRVGDD